MLCEWWQTVQVGAPLPLGSFFPLVSAWPWMLSLNWASTPLWQPPQVVRMLSWLIFDFGSVCGRMSCVPWQSLQTAETTSPDLSTAWPWMLCL